MKTRKRKIKNYIQNLSFRPKLTLLIGCSLLLGVLISVGLVYILYAIVPSVLESYIIWIVGGLSFIIGFACTILLTKTLLKPIERLQGAMIDVSNGDLSIKITETSSSPEIQKTFDAFNLMMQELSSTETIQKDFIANVSHEFKTPITAIEGYATLLQDENNDEQTNKELVEKILLNTQKLSPLITNILLLSKLENQHIPQIKTAYDLGEQIRKCVLALEPSWTAKNIDFDIELEDIKYIGNEGIMSHVWSNLIGNAIKFSPTSKQIFLRLYKKEGEILFTVEDQGAGINEETKRHLFDKFYQADTSHKTEGNGLGLALVKRILTLVGGEISVENAKNGGCKFTVILKNS